MKQIIKYGKYVIIILIIALIATLVIISNQSKQEDVTEVSIEQPIEEQKEQKEEIKKIKVDIKGEVNNPGVYELNVGSRVNDQTTPNMIQRISGIFERNPLISKEIKPFLNFN